MQARFRARLAGASPMLRAAVALGLLLLLTAPAASATMAYVGTCIDRCYSARVEATSGGAAVSGCNPFAGCFAQGVASPAPLPLPPPGRVDCDWFAVAGYRVFVCQDLRET